MTRKPAAQDGPAEPGRWVGIGRASELLGVNPATVRQWSDHGRLRMYVTPGGHRRFLESELIELVGRGAPDSPSHLSDLILATRERYETVARRWLADRSWFIAFDEPARQTFRILGNSMLQLMTGYLVAGRRERERCLEQGRQVAERYGAHAAELGLSLPQTTEAFLLFRNPVLDSVTRWLREQPAARRGSEDSLRRVNAFMDQALVRMAAAHEAYRTGQMEGGQP